MGNCVVNSQHHKYAWTIELSGWTQALCRQSNTTLLLVSHQVTDAGSIETEACEESQR